MILSIVLFFFLDVDENLFFDYILVKKTIFCSCLYINVFVFFNGCGNYFFFP